MEKYLKKLICIAIIISVLGSNLAAVASDELSIVVKCDPSSYVVTVSGSYKEAVGRVLTITAAKSDITLGSVTDENVHNRLSTFGQAVVNKDGKYEYSFLMGTGWSKGLYTLHVNGINSISNEDFVYSRPEDGAAVLPVINFDRDALQSNLEKYQYELLLDFTDYNNLTKDEKKAAVVSVGVLVPTGGFTNVASVNYAFNQSVGLVLFNKAVQNQVADLLGRYSEYMQFDNSEYEKMNSEQKKYFNDFLCKVKYDTVVELKNRITTGIPISIVSKAAKYDEIERVLSETYKDVFSVNFSGDYQRVKDKSGVYKRMIRTYSTIEEIQTAFITAVSAQLEYEKSQADSIGGGGNGGGGGGGAPQSQTMPVGAVVIDDNSALTSNPIVPAEYFSDLDGVDWAKDSIISLAEKNIVAGNENRLFMPNDNITRAQFIKMIVLSIDALSLDAVSEFIDVPQDSWMYPYISSAYDLGIILGDGNGHSGSSDNIIRQDMAVIIKRSIEAVDIGLESIGEFDPFIDNEKIEDYAQESAAYVKTHGLMSGVGNNEFAPERMATRAEAAVLIHRLLNLINK